MSKWGEQWQAQSCRQSLGLITIFTKNCDAIVKSIFKNTNRNKMTTFCSAFATSRPFTFDPSAWTAASWPTVYCQGWLCRVRPHRHHVSCISCILILRTLKHNKNDRNNAIIVQINVVLSYFSLNQSGRTINQQTDVIPTVEVNTEI